MSLLTHALATLSAGATHLRRAAKPLHPRGAVVTGTLVRTGSTPPSGVEWLDGTGTDEVLVRRSRSVGLPGGLPDVDGLAVRVPVGGTNADILLSGSGLGPLTRFLLVPTVRPGTSPLGSLMPFRGPRGPVLLAARPTGRDTYDLAWATPRSSWTVFARLTLDEEPTQDAEVSFDAVLHPVPGLTAYDWAYRLREPAYRAARRASGRSIEGSGVPAGHR